MNLIYFSALQLIDPNKANLPQTSASEATLKKILTDFFVTLGAIAVLMLVIAGVRYIFARGTPEKTTQARNMIQYSLIGLAMAALASTIVNLVLDKAS